MRKIFANFVLLLLIPTLVESSEFDHFINENNFKRISNDLINLSLGNCKRVKNAGGKLSYKEIKLLRDGDSVIDFNKHYMFSNSYQSKNYGLPFFSITLWSWYKNVALKAGNFKYLSSYKQSMQRRNMVVSEQFFVSLEKDSHFTLWLEQDSDAPDRFFYGQIQIKNSKQLADCFDG